MNALISGQAGLALVVDGDRLATIHADDPDVTVDRHAGEVRYLVGEGRDFVPIENVARDEIVRELLVAQDREDALELALILLDSEMPDDIRQESAQELEELLGQESVARYVEGVLYAKPLPDSADAEGGLSLARAADYGEVARTFERLQESQATIREVRDAWEAIPWSRLNADEETWQFVAAREGIFHDLVLNRLNNAKSSHDLCADAASRPMIRPLPEHRGVLHAWFKLPNAASGPPEPPPELQANVIREPSPKYSDPSSYDHTIGHEAIPNVPRGEAPIPDRESKKKRPRR